MQIKTGSRKKRNAVVIGSILFLVLLLSAGYAAYSILGQPDVAEDGINYAPATDQDRELNDNIKEEIISGSDQTRDNENSETGSPTTDADKRKVSVVISAYGQPDGPGTDFTLNGYTPDVIEKDARCTLIMSKDGVEASVSKAALVNAQNTSCGQLVIPFEKLSPGMWQAVLSYDSPDATGRSNVTTVEVK